MKSMRLHVLAMLLSAALWLPRTGPVAADPIGGIISYQGKLTNPDRTPIADGLYNVTFTFFANGTNTGITQTIPVHTFGGVFSTFLNVGAMSFDPANTYELDVAANGTEAKFPIASVPVAQVAKTVTGALNGDVIGTQTATKVTAVQGVAVANTAPAAGQVLTYNSTTMRYEPVTPANSYVDLSSAQTVDGAKTFTSAVTAPQYNIAGSSVLSLTGGADSLAVGVGAGAANTGPQNAFLGRSAGQSNTTGDANTFLGYKAGWSNSTGDENTFVGTIAGQVNTTGNRNAFIGFGAGQANTTGGNNAFVGFFTGLSNTTGNQNVFVGYQAGDLNTTGYSNTFVGVQAGASNNNTGNTTGSANTFLGQNAAAANSTGNNNIALGYFAGQNLTTGDNNIDIGNPGVADEANVVRIGTTQTDTFLAGNVHATAFVTPSSRRFKQDITPIGDRSRALLQLRPVSYRYTAKYLNAAAPSPQQYGLIAEDVAKVYPELVHLDKAGRPDGVRYQDLSILLLNEAQRQQRTIDEQQNAIGDLQRRLARLEKKP